MAHLSQDDVGGHDDFPTPDDKMAVWAHRHPETTVVPCPSCKGYGGHNLRLHAYPLPPGIADTLANRHLYCHLRAFCLQCNEWGVVYSGTANATCAHVWGEHATIGNCLHRVTCTLCGYQREYDSSG